MGVFRGLTSLMFVSICCGPLLAGDRCASAACDKCARRQPAPHGLYAFESPGICPADACRDGSCSACRQASDCRGDCEPCSKCRGIRCRKCRPAVEGLESDFNCQCQGSYKHPVPPLYTYHWPGMYSQQSMLEYTSPWRHPGIKPLLDAEWTDPLEGSMLLNGAPARPASARQASARADSAEQPLRPRTATSRPRSMSERMRQMR